MKLRNLLIIGSVTGLALVTLVVAAVLLVPVAFAQGPLFDGTPGFNRMQSGPMMRQESPAGAGYSRLTMNQNAALGPMAGQNGPQGMGGPGSSLVAVVAEQLGMEQADLITELQAGKTMAEVITEQGGDIEAIIDVFMASRQERLETMVENGRITREQADAMLAVMRANVTERLNSAWSARGQGNGLGFIDEDGDGVCDRAGQGRGQGAGQGQGRMGRQGNGMMGRWANVY